MPSNYTTDDLVFGQIDLDDKFIKDTWLIDRFNGTSLWGYGDNTNGQLGNGTQQTYYSSPIQVGSLTDWKQVVCGQFHTLGLKTNNTLWAWGVTPGVGAGSASYSSPIAIGALTNWSQLAAGASFSTAIKTDGTFWAWGYNVYGAIGQNNVIGYSSPVQVGALTNWKQMDSSGEGHTAAVKTDGTLWTWGYNLRGQLGNNTVSISYSSPIQIGALTNWKQPSLGDNCTSVIKTNGTLWIWGETLYTLGVEYSSPVQIGSLTDWQQASIGDSHILAIKTDGTLWTWGYNLYGQLGNMNIIDYSSPIQIGALTNWKYVYIPEYAQSSYAIKTDGTHWVWGIYSNTGFKYSSPVQIGTLSNWKSINGFSGMLMAIKFDDIK